MKMRVSNIAWMMVALLVAAGGCRSSDGDRTKESVTTPQQERLFTRAVSLAPSITEILFALGLGDRVIGVTHYCDYPKAALNKPKVGGYTQPNYETIASLKPDVVFLLEHHRGVMDNLDRLGVHWQMLDSRSVAAVLQSMRTVGRLMGVEAKATALTASLTERLERVKQSVAGAQRPRVLVSIGRSMGTALLTDVFIAGPGSFFDEVITLAGGINAYRGTVVQYPKLSAEGILSLNPEVIIDLVPDLEQKKLTVEQVTRQWQTVRAVSAVSNNRVHVLGQDYVVIPGPRIVLLVEQLAELFHPSSEIE